MTDEQTALKSLHERLIDSRDGYEQASQHVESGHLKTLFSELHERRDNDAAELRKYLKDADHDLDDDGTILAAAHRQFLGLKDALGGEDAAVVTEVIRGERTLLEAYDEALTPMGAGSPGFELVSRMHKRLTTRVDELETEKNRVS